MNGANADPSVRTINAPNNIKKMTIGANHHFFPVLRNSQNSFMMEYLLVKLFLFDGHHTNNGD